MPEFVFPLVLTTFAYLTQGVDSALFAHFGAEVIVDLLAGSSPYNFIM